MEVSTIIDRIVNRLKEVRGVEAIVLGGSRAKGTHTERSDIDIGIYYDDEKRLDVSSIAQAASSLDDLGRDSIITPVGEWGPWINGGGWLQIGGYPVDFLYRDLRKVRGVVADCLNGKVTVDYQPGHAHGFVNAIYVGEIASCRILWDPQQAISSLKAAASPYPDKLKKALIERFLWEASFSLKFTTKSIARIDVSHAAGYMFRAVSCLNQTLFAMNETYWINETGAVDMASRFARSPDGYKDRVNRLFSLLSSDTERMKEAAGLLENLIRETERLAGS